MNSIQVCNMRNQTHKFYQQTLTSNNIKIAKSMKNSSTKYPKPDNKAQKHPHAQIQRPGARIKGIEADSKAKKQNNQNEDIDWLEKIVNGFSWYKDSQDPLFRDEKDIIKSNQVCARGNDGEFVKVRLIETNTQRFSQRKQQKQSNLNQNYINNSQSRKYVPKVYPKDRDKDRTQIYNKNSSFAKNNINISAIYPVKNKRSQSQGTAFAKKKQYSIYVPQASFNKVRLIERDRNKDVSKQDRLRFKDKKQKTIPIATVSTQPNNQKQPQQTPTQPNLNRDTNLGNTAQNFNQTNRNIGNIIQICGINQFNDDIIKMKMKNKLSVPESRNALKNEVIMSSKVQVKAEKRNFGQAGAQGKADSKVGKSYGKIVKNKSIQLKQRRNGCFSMENIRVTKNKQQEKEKLKQLQCLERSKQKYKNSIIYSLQNLNKSNKNIMEKLQQKYIVNQFSSSQQRNNSQNQRSKQRSARRKQYTGNQFLNINNQIQKLLSLQKNSKLQRNILGSNDSNLPNKSASKMKGAPNEFMIDSQPQPKAKNIIQQIKAQKEDSSNKNLMRSNQKIKQNGSNKKDLQMQKKKYNYLIQKINLQNRCQKLYQKKQRKLNSSFAERKILQSLKSNQNGIINISATDCMKDVEKNLNNNQAVNNLSSNSIHTISFSARKKQDYIENSNRFRQKQNAPQIQKQIKLLRQKSEQKLKQILKNKQSEKQRIEEKVKKTLLIETNHKKQQKDCEGKNETKKFEQIYQNVKFVQSTKNSQVLTQQSFVMDSKSQANMSLVEQKLFKKADTVTNSNFNSNCNSASNQQWNIMQIFSRLDRKKMGVLNANNCSIQFISRQIRYILGPVLQQILYRNTSYNFAQFIHRVQKTLQHIKGSQIPTYQPQRYLKIKQWAPETQRHISSKLKTEQNSQKQSLNLNPTISNCKSSKNQSQFLKCNLNQKISSQISRQMIRSNVLEPKQCQSQSFLVNYSSANPNTKEKSYSDVSRNMYIDSSIKTRLSSNSKKDGYFNGEAKTLSKNNNQPSSTSSNCKKYQYSKNFIQFGQIQTQPPTMKKQVKQKVRFATFQDQQSDQIEKEDNSFDKQNHFMQKMEQKLERKLQVLNQFESTFGPNYQIKIKSQVRSSRGQKLLCSKNIQQQIVENKDNFNSGSQVGKSDYKSQIIKLEILNKRLQKYLHDQTLKQFSTSKLLVEDI